MTNPKHTPIVVVGSVNSDVTYHVTSLPLPGETVLASQRHDAPGGKGANQGAAIASFGIPVSLIAAVGSDEQGDHLIDSLTNKGVNTDHVEALSGERSGSAIILVDDKGENSIIVHAGSNLALSPESAANSIKALKPSYVLAQLEVSIETVIAAAAEHEGTFILNPAPIPSDISPAHVSQLLSVAHILIPNRSELARLANMPEPTTTASVIECARKLDFQGTLIVTIGSQGALLFADSPHSDPLHISAPTVNAIDTSGAGDAFCGAFVSSLYLGYSLVDSVTRACEFAGWTTTQIGAQVPRDHEFAFNLAVS